MGLTVDRIVAELPHMSKPDRDRILVAIRALDCLGLVEQSKKRTEDVDLDWSLDAIVDVFVSHGVEFPSRTMLIRSNSYSGYKAKLTQVMRFLDGFDRAEKRALFTIGIKLLYENLAQLGIPVTAGTILGHVHRVPGVINKAFPGYAEAGMLGLVIGKGPGNVRQKHPLHVARTSTK